MCHVTQSKFLSHKQLVSITDDGDEKSKQIFIQGSNFFRFRTRKSEKFPIKQIILNIQIRT